MHGPLDRRLGNLQILNQPSIMTKHNFDRKIFDEIPVDAGLCILTGANGSGKTRALSAFAEQLVKNIDRQSISCRRVICLSGTVLDRFPSKPSDETYLYFGKRINNNMFSEIEPFRILVFHMLRDVDDYEHRAGVAGRALEKIGFSSLMLLRFRRGRNSGRKDYIEPADVKKTGGLDININLNSKYHENKNLNSRLFQMNLGFIHLRDIVFEKSNTKIGLSELSSGERAYILSILALAFGVVDDSMVLFDEPENSLHPSWQSTIVGDIWNTITEVSLRSCAIIATHSPLVISGASNKATYVRDLTANAGWIRSGMYGNNSDSILLDQFGMDSPRAMSVLNLIQDCLRAAIDISSNADGFKEAADKLLSRNIRVGKDDPLYLTIKKIEELRRRAT